MPASPVFDTAARRCVAVLAAGLMLPPALAGCSNNDDSGEGKSGAARDVSAFARDRTAAGGTVRWAVDSMPGTLNAFQADADETTDRIAEATLPSMFTLDSRARPQLNGDYLESAEVTAREPQQTVLYELSPKARWSDGKSINVADFIAQWKALSGTESAFWSARNAGYDRIHKVEKGDNLRQVKVTFARPYSDWRALFTPLYPRSVMGDSQAFNDSSRKELPLAGGPFRLKGGKLKPKAKDVTLERNPDWWGDRARLESIVLTPVEKGKRAKALAQGKLDLAEIEMSELDAVRPSGSSNKPPGARPGQAEASESAETSEKPDTSEKSKETQAAQESADEASNSPSPSASSTSSSGPSSSATDEEKPAKSSADDKDDAADEKDDEDDEAKDADEKDNKEDKKAEKAAEKARKAAEKRAAAQRQKAEERRNLSELTVRRALSPAYTQLAMNGSSGPLKDERVRRAVGRALDREKLAKGVLDPVGLPSKPLGSHLRTYDQDGYQDTSDALGESGAKAAAAQLADAGWKGGPSLDGGDIDPADAKGDSQDDGEGAFSRTSVFAEVTHRSATAHAAVLRQTAYADARAAKAAKKDGGAKYEKLNTVAESSLKEAKQADRALSRFLGGLLTAEGGLVRAKGSKKLELRMVLPSGEGSGQLRETGRRIAYMLEGVGISAKIDEVGDDAYFEDHIASGDFDLALYSWPGSAYPATDSRPVFAKPVPAPDGSLLIEQNYTRVGSDQIDHLFEQAATELDDKARAEVLGRIDARVWAAAGSVPLYQRPELVAVKKKIVNAGAFGFETPRYQDIGYRK